MSEHKHTQGEWTKHISADEKPRAIDRDDGDCWVSQDLSFGVGKKVIGEVKLRTLSAAEGGGYPYVDNIHELKANLALILAAPEQVKRVEKLEKEKEMLLEALENFVENGPSEEASCFAREVIANVEGEPDADPD